MELSVVRTSIKVSLISGAIAAVFMGLLVYAFVSPLMDRAVELEPEGEEPEVVVPRETQKQIAILGSMLWGILTAMAFGITYPFVHSNRKPVAVALLISIIAYFVTVIVPFTKYPPTPPGVGYEITLDLEAYSYAITIMLGFAGALASALMYLLLRKKRNKHTSLLIAIFTGIPAFAFIYLVLPSTGSLIFADPAQANLIAEYRAALFLSRLAYWIVLGLSFGYLFVKFSKHEPMPEREEMRSRRPLSLLLGAILLVALTTYFSSVYSVQYSSAQMYGTLSEGSNVIDIMEGSYKRFQKENYSPHDVIILLSSNSTITWNNLDMVSHTVTSDEGFFDSGFIPSNRSWSYTFTDKGEFSYHCSPHPWMKGKVKALGQ